MGRDWRHALRPGVSGQSQLYDPQRIQKPLLRVGERGEGKWKEVSYEEAYDYIAKQMQKLRKNTDRSDAFGCRKGPHMSYLYTLAKAYGSPNMHNHESTCPLARTVGLEVTLEQQV